MSQRRHRHRHRLGFVALVHLLDLVLAPGGRWRSSRAKCAARRDGCDVCSISWGADEADWGHPSLNVT